MIRLVVIRGILPVRRRWLAVAAAVAGSWAFLPLATEARAKAGQVEVVTVLPAASPFVEVQTVVEDVVLAMRYATTDNFLGKAVYPDSRAWLRQPAADLLKKAADDLRPRGYRLKVWDAYRPWSVQKAMWDLVKDGRYVADPAKGSVHNRGGAVDLTLVTATGEPVEMPTDFDDFSERAHHGAKGVPAAAAANAALLKAAMERAGWRSIRTEWWHYQVPDAARFPVYDVVIGAQGGGK